MKLLKNRLRILIVLSAFLCLSMLASNYIIVNMTFICMQEDLSDAVINENGTLVSRYAYDPSEKSLIIWAVALGTIIGTFPYNMAFIRWGAKYPFLSAGILSTITTLLIPYTASVSLPGLLVLRVIQGITYSADFSAIGVVTVRWAPVDETSLMIAVMTSFVTFSTFVTNTSSAWFCSSIGWRWAFYSHGIATGLVFVLWMFVYRDDPTSHPKITKKELAKLQENKTKAELEVDHYVPFIAILSNLPVWVICLNGLTLITTLTLIMTYMPMYLHLVLKFDVMTTGMLAAVGAFSHAPIKYFSGYFSDKSKAFSEATKLQICNFFALCLPGVFFVLLGVMKDAFNGILAVVLFFAIFISMGANCGGYWKAATVVSKQYAHFVLSIIQFMKCVALITAPCSWYLFVENETDIQQWSYVFYLNGGCLIFAGGLFYLCCNDKPAEFTKMTRSNPRGDKVDAEALSILEDKNSV
ncbi:unnamed protein product, partial [Mesorhabditis spiculigera]